MIGRYSRNHDNILTNITRKIAEAITEARRENLLRAVREGNVKAVTKYVAKYGDNQHEINFYYDGEGFTVSKPLMTVCEILASPNLKNAEPYLQILRVLLGASKINLTTYSERERSVFHVLAPLTSAAGQQAFAILWEHCNPDMKNYIYGDMDQAGGTPLVIAARANAIANVDLIMSDLQVHIPGRPSECTSRRNFANYALFIAAEEYHPEIFCKMYAGHGIELDLERCRADKSYFLFALLNNECMPRGSTTIERIINKHQFDVNAKDELGRTLLTLAIQKKYTKIINALLEYKGIDVNAKDAAGMTPILHAFNVGDLATAEKLIARDDISDLHVTDQQGRSVLTMPDDKTSYTFVEKLMANKNFDANTLIEGMAPLLYLLKKGCTKAAAMMAGRKDIKDINAVNETGRTALSEVIVQHYIGNDDMRKAAKLIFPLLMAMPDIDVSKPDKHGMTPLLYAISAVSATDTDPFTRELLKRKDLRELNVRDGYGRTALFIAIENISKTKDRYLWSTVYDLLDQKDVDINIADNAGIAPLLLAVSLGVDNIAYTLIDRREINNLNACDTLGRTALYCSIQRGYSYLAAKLIDRDDVNVGAATKDGVTPLLLAVRYGYTDIAMRILARKDVQALNAVDSVGKSALHYAAAKNNLDLVDALLLKDGVDLNFADKDGVTPLIAAIMNGNTDVALKLIERMDAAGINAKDKNGVSALFAAVKKEDVKVIDALLARQDIDINAATNNLDTPLFEALRRGNIDVANKLLSRQEINVTVLNKDGESAVSLAVLDGSRMLEILEHLLQRPEVDIDVLNSRGDKGRTPLQLAMESNVFEVAERLLATRRINTNIVSDAGHTALEIAATLNIIKMVNLLLDHGAKVDFADKHGNTLLLNGMRDNNRTLVRIALDHGASMSHQNLQGDNALLMAVKAGNTMMLTYLLGRMTAMPQAGIDVNEVFLEAVKRNDADSVVQLLDHVKQTPELHENINEAFIAAVTRNNEAMVDIIYKYGVDLNYICQSTGRTALETALYLNLKGLSDKLFKLENDAKISDVKQPPAPVRQPSLLGKFGLLGVKDVFTDVEAPQSSAVLMNK